MTAMVRAQSLRGYRELVSDLGGDPVRLLRKAGVEPEALNQLTAFVSFESLIQLLEISAADLDCPDFGLRLAERQDIGILGILSVAMLYAATVGEAMYCVAKYLQVYNAAIAFTINTEERRGEALMEFTVQVDRSAQWAQTAEHGIGLTSRIMTLLSEQRCHLQHVWFSHPPVAMEATYRSRFDVPLTFRADRLALAYAARDLNRPISEHNRQLHELATHYLESQLPQRTTPFTGQVRQAVQTLLGTGTCGHRQVASALHMHPRTMQRRLQDEGTTFDQVKDDVRRDFAERYLSQPDVPLSQITALLDYSDQSSLSRGCRRWFQASPSDFRNRLLSGRLVSSMD
ncbi:MAG TPA: AraC family transcriptional regulator [Acidimicrobiales bacterium]|nr:AraC family transcriptional regulator [Acidimicrobiales bacterium]